MRPSEARICKECSNLVTKGKECPLCLGLTEPHPEKDITEGYCVDCGEGPIPAGKLVVRTWEDDPYQQTDDGDLATVCEACDRGKDSE